MGYIFFYAALGIFLILASKICDYVDWSKLMIRSLIGLLFVVFSLSIYDVSETHAYILYQVVFAFFFAGFFAPSLALIYSLLKNDQPFLNGIVWYYIGLSFSYLAGYCLSKELGIFQHYFLFASPLVLSVILCLGMMIAIERSIVQIATK